MPEITQMETKLPSYDSYAYASRDLPARDRSLYTIKVARTLEEIMQMISVRACVFMSEQECPFEEEFDGNDFCAAHLIGYRLEEPIACLRVRFFGDFAKLERLSVRREYRKTRMPFNIVWAGIEFARKKGYRRIYGHAQDRLVKFWSHFGAVPMASRPKLIFSDFAYTEMLLEAEPYPDAISLESDPYVIIRPEGRWDRQGVLERSSVRDATSPLKDLRAA